jgi:hypothetical protein
MSERFVTLTWDFIRDKDTTMQEKLILAEIARIEVLGEIIEVTNLYISNAFGITKQRASTAINSLISKGFIFISEQSDETVYRLLNKKNSPDGCLFCGYKGCAIDRHHYPIRRKNGGEKTIDLCANCHREFHYLADSNRDSIRVNWSKFPVAKSGYLDFIIKGDCK